PVLNEAQDLIVLSLLSHGGIGIAEHPLVSILSEKREYALLPAAALGDVVLLQQRILAMEGNAVKVHIKGHAVLKVQGLQGVEPAAHELRVGNRGNAAAVLGEEAALRCHIEPGKERQSLIEDRTHDVTVPSTAEELQRQQRAHRLGCRDL